MTSPASTDTAAPSGLRRGDIGLLVGALLAVVFSFLPQLKAAQGTGGHDTVATWHGEFLTTQFSVPIAAALAAAFLVGCAFAPGFAALKLVLPMRSWSTALAVVAGVGSVFAILEFHEYNVNVLEKSAKLGYGAYGMLVGAIVCGAFAVLTETLPALAGPLTSSEPKPAAPQGWGQPGQYGQPNQYGQPGQSGQPGPYGQPSGPQYGQPLPAPGQPQYGSQPSFGGPTQPQYGQPEPAPQYGQPEPAPQYGVPEPAPQYGQQPSFGAPIPAAEPEPAAPSWGQPAQPAVPEPTPTITAQLPEDPTRTNIVSRQTPPAVEPAPTPAATAPFWACFPTPRPLVDLADRSATLTQLSPSDWYLITGHDATGAVIRLDDGRSGYLADASGLTRG